MSTISDFLKKTTGIDVAMPLSERVHNIQVNTGNLVRGVADTASDIGDAAKEILTGGKDKKNLEEEAAETQESYPFTSRARELLKDVNYRPLPSRKKGKVVDESTGHNYSENAEYATRGADVYNTVRRFLPQSAATALAKAGWNLDAPTIEARADKAVTGDENLYKEGYLSHEMLHHLYDYSPMGQQAFGEDNVAMNPDATARAGRAWLGAWDAVKSKGTDDPDGDTLTAVDKHMEQTGYDLSDPYSDGNERFAYLGQQALLHGIDVIPKELRPFYYGIIEGAPKPTAENLGIGLNPEEGFNIDIGSPESRTTEESKQPSLLKRVASIAKDTVTGIPNAAAKVAVDDAKIAAQETGKGLGVLGKAALKVGKTGIEAVQAKLDEGNIHITDAGSSSTLDDKTQAAGAAAAEPIAAKPASAQARGVSLSDDDMNELRKILYSEVGNRPDGKRALESKVIINTALNRVAERRAHGVDVSLADVLREPNQYQGYQSKQYKIAESGKADSQKMAEIDSVLSSLKSGDFADNTNGAFYYIHNPDQTITYDDTRSLYAK